MPIHFSPERWNAIRETYRAWWAGDLDRPLYHVTLGGADPGRDEPELPSYGFTSFYGPEVSAEAIADRWDYDLSTKRYVGDAFPNVRPVFGAGMMAAFMGADLVNGAETSWFVPVEDEQIADIEWEYDPDNEWFVRVCDVMRAAMDRWGGQVLVGNTDLGANLDVVSSFRPGHRLPLDLYDHPDEVKRLGRRVRELWWRYFDEFQRILLPENPGYTDWTPIHSEEPYSMLQCDFCYMISPDMFDEFVKPEIVAMCRDLPNSFYHLDGPGELPHLDSLLEIEELDGIQWVPGAGAPEIDQWPEVYRKIRRAGKLIQIWHGRAADGRHFIDVISDQIGGAEGIIVIGNANVEQEGEIVEMMARYGASSPAS